MDESVRRHLEIHDADEIDGADADNSDPHSYDQSIWMPGGHPRNDDRILDRMGDSSQDAEGSRVSHTHHAPVDCPHTQLSSCVSLHIVVRCYRRACYPWNWNNWTAGQTCHLFLRIEVAGRMGRCTAQLFLVYELLTLGSVMPQLLPSQQFDHLSLYPRSKHC